MEQQVAAGASALPVPREDTPDGDSSAWADYRSLRVDTYVDTGRGSRSSSAAGQPTPSGGSRSERKINGDHRVRFHDEVSGGARTAIGPGGGPATTDAAAAAAAAAATAAVAATYSGREKDPIPLGTGVYTGLHLACLNGSVSRARREVSFGADVNAPASGDGDGASPLHLACRCGRDELVRLLLSEGADVTQTNRHGESPLHYAAAGGHEAIAARLLAAGGSTAASSVDSRGRTPLHNACDGDTTTTPDASLQPCRAVVADATSRSSASATSATAPAAAAAAAAATASVNTTATTAPAAAAANISAATASDGGRVNVARLLVNAGADPGARTTAPVAVAAAAAAAAATAATAAPNTGVGELSSQGGVAGGASGGVGGIGGTQSGAIASMRVGAGAGGAAESPGAAGVDEGGRRQGGGEAGMTPLHFACRRGSAELAGYLLHVGASALAKDDSGCEPGDDFSPWVSREERHAVEVVIQSARGRQEARELRAAVASLTKRMLATETRGTALASENLGLAERLHLQETRGTALASENSHLAERLRLQETQGTALASENSGLAERLRLQETRGTELVSENLGLAERLRLQETRTKGQEQQIAGLEEEVARQRGAIDEGVRRESAFKKETTELANQTRRLGRGIRELAETSPQLREVVRALSGRVDGLKTEGEVVADLNRRLEACEGRLQTRVAELAVKLDGVCQMERTSHSPASQACLCSGQIEAVAAKVGVLSGGHGAALRRLDDLASDVSAVERAVKHAEVASVTKLDLQAHELGALVERRVAQLRSEVDVQLARAWQLVGRGAGVTGAGGLAAARDGAALARGSMMSPPRRDTGGGSGDGSGGERALTDMVLALQLRVGELDCEVLKLREKVSAWERTVRGASTDSTGTLLTLQPSPSSSSRRHRHHHHHPHPHHKHHPSHRHPSKATTAHHQGEADDDNNNNFSSSSCSSSSSSLSPSPFCRYCHCCCCCYGSSSSNSDGAGYRSTPKRSSSTVARSSVFDAGLRESTSVGISGAAVSSSGGGGGGGATTSLGSRGRAPWQSGGGAMSDQPHVRFKRHHHYCCGGSEGTMRSSGKVNKASTKAARRCRKGLHDSRRSAAEEAGDGGGRGGGEEESEEEVERRLRRLEDAIFLL